MKGIALAVTLSFVAVCFSLSAEERVSLSQTTYENNVVYGPIKSITSGPQGLLIHVLDEVPYACPQHNRGPWLTIKQEDRVMVTTAMLAWMLGLNVHVYISDKDDEGTYYCRVVQVDPDNSSPSQQAHLSGNRQ